MILIVGATGQVGGMIARKLLEDGHSVRILARPGSGYQALEAAGAQAVFGDLKDRGSLDRACEGIEIVITTANSAQRGGDDNIQSVDLDGNRSLIDAAQAAGVRHFIFTSAYGASIDSPAPFLRAKALSEEHLRASGMQYTILEPDVYLEVWVPLIVDMPVQAGKPVTLMGDASARHTYVSAGDVAAYGAGAVTNPAALNQVLYIGGHEALTWRDIVRKYEELVGREVPIQYVPKGSPLPGLPEHVGQLMTALESYETEMDMTELSRTFGVRPTPLEEVLRRNIAGAAM